MLGNQNSQMFNLLFDVLEAVSNKPCGRYELADKLGVSAQVIGRQVKILRDQFGISFSTSAKYGYVVKDWGVIHPERFKDFMAERKSAQYNEIRK